MRKMGDFNITTPTPVKTPNVASRHDDNATGMVKSMLPMSDENLDMHFPEGTLSKKDNGAERIDVNN
jgi:hypothetical protein